MYRSSNTTNQRDALSLDLNPINNKPATDNPTINLEGERYQSDSGDDSNNNRNPNPQQPLECSDTADKQAELRMTINKLKWIINHQRMILLGYGDLAQRHAELKCEFDLISLENTMLKLDLERERWTHDNEMKVMKSHQDRKRRSNNTNVRSTSFLKRATSTIQAGLSNEVVHRSLRMKK